MKNKRIASALLVLLLILITVFGGCKEKAMDVFEGYMHLFGGH